MATLIQLRRDTSANWSSANPILAQGEMGYDITNDSVKVGNGTDAWNDLSYIAGESFNSLDSDWVLSQIPGAVDNQVDSDWVATYVADNAGGGGGATVLFDKQHDGLVNFTNNTVPLFSFDASIYGFSSFKMFVSFYADYPGESFFIQEVWDVGVTSLGTLPAQHFGGNEAYAEGVMIANQGISAVLVDSFSTTVVGNTVTVNMVTTDARGFGNTGRVRLKGVGELHDTLTFT